MSKMEQIERFLADSKSHVQLVKHCDDVKEKPEYKDWRYDTTPFPAAAELGKNMMSKHSIKETV